MKIVGPMAFEFVREVPEKLEDGVLYVSIPYCTALHRCPCGCGAEVITPIAPTDWKLIFDGDSISLSPSIGNWSFPCKSHYWIRRSRIVWAEELSPEEIASIRRRDAAIKKGYFGWDG